MYSSIENVFALLRSSGRTAERVVRRILVPTDTLDMEVLPDYLKRDIGLMEGRDPKPQPELYR